jgi:DNA processing protein
MNNRGLLDLIISILPELKPVEKIKLLNSFCHEEELYLQPKKYIEEILNRSITKNWDMLEYRNKADRIDTVCKMRSIKWVSWTNSCYPPLLREIYDPPTIIFYRGNLPNPEKSLLGMVGTRRPSPEGAAQAYKLAYGTGLYGISVVSGLALGIDTMSHRGNLAATVPGYAVLGSGIDEIYPSTNRSVAKKILDLGGAIISEYPPGIRPGKWTFPARNRIISGLSRSVLIVEAPEKSGALITASFALEQGKDLWTSSTGIQENAAFDKRGTIKLAQDGAEIITTESDITDKWGMQFGEMYGNTTPSNTKETIKEYITSLARKLEIDIS